MKFSNIRMRAFTLIELIITIAIVGIVLSSVMSFFGYNLNLFSKGDQLSQVQFDVRMASDFIMTELRNVTEIGEAAITGGSSINLTTLKAEYSLVTNVSFQIIKEQSRNLVRYTVSGNSTNGKNPYSVSSDVLLNNIYNLPNGTAGLTEIFFKK